MNILDIAQNSVRAGATLVNIEVAADSTSDILKIGVLDNGCGMTPEQISRVTDPFYTTRTTRKVGLGIPLLKMAAEMTGGTLSIQSEPGCGCTVWATFGLSHIDRMPLGDLSSTATALIGACPQIDFVFNFSADGTGFTADTREFKRIMGDIPLSSPQVLQFIGDYITDNLPAALV